MKNPLCCTSSRDLQMDTLSMDRFKKRREKIAPREIKNPRPLDYWKCALPLCYVLWYRHLRFFNYSRLPMQRWFHIWSNYCSCMYCSRFWVEDIKNPKLRGSVRLTMKFPTKAVVLVVFFIIFRIDQHIQEPLLRLRANCIMEGHQIFTSPKFTSGNFLVGSYYSYWSD